VPKVIDANSEDAMSYGLNALSDGKNIILSDHPANLIKTYKELGFNLLTLPITEFQKSGGGVKCLTLELN